MTDLLPTDTPQIAEDLRIGSRSLLVDEWLARETEAVALPVTEEGRPADESQGCIVHDRVSKSTYYALVGIAHEQSPECTTWEAANAAYESYQVEVAAHLAAFKAWSAEDEETRSETPPEAPMLVEEPGPEPVRWVETEVSELIPFSNIPPVLLPAFKRLVASL